MRVTLRLTEVGIQFSFLPNGPKSNKIKEKKKDSNPPVQCGLCLAVRHSQPSSTEAACLHQDELADDHFAFSSSIWPILGFPSALGVRKGIRQSISSASFNPSLFKKHAFIIFLCASGVIQRAGRRLCLTPPLLHFHWPLSPLRGAPLDSRAVDHQARRAIVTAHRQTVHVRVWSLESV